MALNRPQPPKISSVAALLAMDRTTLTANLKPLERRELVDIVADPEDRRSRLLRLTPGGRDVLGAAFPIWEKEHAAVDASLDCADLDMLRRGLAKLA